MSGTIGKFTWAITTLGAVMMFTLNPLDGIATTLTQARAISEDAAITSGEGATRMKIAVIASQVLGRVGVSATVLETGRHISLNAQEKFPMQSVYKLPIGMAILRQVDDGKLSLDQVIQITPADYVAEQQHSPIRDAHPGGTRMTIRHLLKWMVAESDGSACDVLLNAGGGPQQVMAFLAGLDVAGIAVVNTEKEIGSDNEAQFRNYATPEGIAKLLGKLHRGEGLSNASRDRLVQMMIESPTGKKRIRGLLPAGTVVAHKTGSSRTVNGVTAATNDVGIVTLPDGKHLVLAVFVSDSNANSETRERVIAEIAREAYNWAVAAGDSQ